MEDVRLEAWHVHDSGLLVAPGRFRRLPGAVRHHGNDAQQWPATVVIELSAGGLRVQGTDGATLGEWSADQCSARVVAAGPPATFVLDVPGGDHLLATGASDGLDLLVALVGGT